MISATASADSSSWNVSPSRINSANPVRSLVLSLLGDVADEGRSTIPRQVLSLCRCRPTDRAT